MSKFQNLHLIVEHIEDAFQNFYDSMLHDARLSVFFESEAQINHLINSQKNHFEKSLSMDSEELKQLYIRLGEYHYDIRIPYVDFIKGTEILEEHFLLCTQEHLEHEKLMPEIFSYFKIMKSFTAKGYLNRMLTEDLIDIDLFFEQMSQNSQSYLPTAIVLEKIHWLKGLLVAISENKEYNDPNSDTILTNWLKQEKKLSLEKRAFFENLEQRLIMNTKNLFFFLMREEYLEILPLYTSLLSIYKLTLMMNNALTIEYANKLIEDMRLDSMTQLYRKEVFIEILKQELELGKRDEANSVAYLDIDNFKSINDNFGHYSGDKVIEKLGELIRNNIRASDFGFRIGGDEFAIIFKHTDKHQAKTTCNKIRLDLSSFEFIFNQDITFNVSISIGISEFSGRSEQNPLQVIESVDNKLYQAKHRGKNQINL